MSKPWTVRDIRTGRALGKTRDPFNLMLEQVDLLQAAGKELYFAVGPIRHADVLEAVRLLKDAHICVVRDRQLPPDVMLLFEGRPDELGFAV